MNEKISTLIHTPLYTQEQVNKLSTAAFEKGNIPSLLFLLLHNQGLINKKINKLLGIKGNINIHEKGETIKTKK